MEHVNNCQLITMLPCNSNSNIFEVIAKRLMAWMSTINHMQKIFTAILHPSSSVKEGIKTLKQEYVASNGI